MDSTFGLNTISHGNYYRGMYSTKKGSMRGISTKDINCGLIKNRPMTMDMITDMYDGMYFINCPVNVYVDDIDYEYMDQFYLSKPLSSISADFRIRDYLR